MIDDVIIEPMSEKCLLWRCLHGGPLSRETVDQWPPGTEMPWERYRERNLPLLTKIVRIYGPCAFLARDGDAIVGMLRFYPKVVCSMEGAGGLCLLQEHPAGPADDFGGRDLPGLGRIEDIPLIYEITGSTGHSFWEKLGFRLVDRHPHPEQQDRSQYLEFIEKLEEQAASVGISPDRARDRLVMRFDLTSAD